MNEKPTLPKCVIYTDGAYSHQYGIGGWAWVHMERGTGKIASFMETGYTYNTTSNRMEMTAAIKALEFLPSASDIFMYTDSKYLQQGFDLWMHNWKKSGWKTSSKEPVKNQDLWEILLQLKSRHIISMRWVKGHSGHHGNELVDRLAKEAVGKGKIMLQYR